LRLGESIGGRRLEGRGAARIDLDRNPVWIKNITPENLKYR
jgi:hypothetical protein